MTHALITPPGSEALSLAEAKAHLRLDSNDEDILIASLMTTARQYLERATGLCLITQVWRLYLDGWPAGAIVPLAKAPVQAVVDLRIFDDAGVEMAQSPVLTLDRVSRPARLMVTNAVKPGQNLNGIEIDYRTGFGDTAPDVPDSLKRAMLTHIAMMYELRGAITPGLQPGGIPDGYDRLIAPFMLRGL